MKKIHEIKLIPIEKQSGINEYQSLIYKQDNNLYYCYDSTYSLEKAVPQRMLLLGDILDEIKERDYVYEDNLGKTYLYWVEKRRGKLGFFRFKNVWIDIDKSNCRKVIATSPKYDNILSISDEFIKEWIENDSFNNEIEVDYLGSSLKIINNEVVCNLLDHNYGCKCKECITEDAEDDAFRLQLENDHTFMKLCEQFENCNDTIEESALKYTKKHLNNSYYVFIDGVKSDAAKKYWFEEFKKSQEGFSTLEDLRPFMLRHPNQKMVKDSCLHYLGDLSQHFSNEENIKNLFKLFCQKFSLYRGIQITDSDIDDFLKEYRNKC
jgi:hypothetical protein